MVITYYIRIPRGYMIDISDKADETTELKEDAVAVTQDTQEKVQETAEDVQGLLLIKYSFAKKKFFVLGQVAEVTNDTEDKPKELSDDVEDKAKEVSNAAEGNISFIFAAKFIDKIFLLLF